MFEKRDNSTLRQKVSLRRTGLGLLKTEPTVMETHGGMGEIYLSLYQHVENGVVFEVDAIKCGVLATQRATWAVYQADCEIALAKDAGSHLEVNFLDVDPYGDSWTVINAFFSSSRPFAKRMVIAVNDGLRQKICIGGAWDCKSLSPIVMKWGNDLWHHYLAGCRELLQLAVENQGYEVRKFEGYHCGEAGRMTHFLSMIER